MSVLFHLQRDLHTEWLLMPMEMEVGIGLLADPSLVILTDTD